MIYIIYILYLQVLQHIHTSCNDRQQTCTRTGTDQYVPRTATTNINTQTYIFVYVYIPVDIQARSGASCVSSIRIPFGSFLQRISCRLCTRYQYMNEMGGQKAFKNHDAKRSQLSLLGIRVVPCIVALEYSDLMSRVPNQHARSTNIRALSSNNEQPRCSNNRVS